MNVCLSEVFKAFQGSLKGVSMKIEGSSERPLRGIQGSFKVSKRNSMGIKRQLQIYFKEVSRMVEESVKFVSAKLIKSFKGVSRIFQ